MKLHKYILLKSLEVTGQETTNKNRCNPDLLRQYVAGQLRDPFRVLSDCSLVLTAAGSTEGLRLRVL